MYFVILGLAGFSWEKLFYYRAFHHVSQLAASVKLIFSNFQPQNNVYLNFSSGIKYNDRIETVLDLLDLPSINEQLNNILLNMNLKESTTTP